MSSAPPWTYLQTVVTVCSILLAGTQAQGQHPVTFAPEKRKVPQASVSPHPIRLPIIDGTDIRFTRLSNAGGLALTRVVSIVQDDQGFMWFGTQYGLNRFDGYNFKVFVADPGNSTSLSGVFIKSIFKDRQGTLWVGCEQSLNRFDRTNETFTKYPVLSVIHISQDTAGVLWLATPTGLYGLDPVTRELNHYSHYPNDPTSLGSNDIQFSGEDRQGRFWVANSEGLDEFDRKTAKVTLHIPLHEPSSGFSFYEDRFGVFWIYHLSPNSLAVFDRSTNKLTHFSFDQGIPARMALTGISAMLEDREGNLWLASHGAGLLKFDREHDRFIRYRNSAVDPESLPQNNVESLFADQEGSIWVGLGRMGLARFDRNPRPFQRFPHLDSPDNSVQPFVGAIYQDHHGILWIGTPAALNRIDLKTDAYTYYHRAANPVPATDVIAICEDRQGNLWVGTYGHGLLRFNRRSGHFKTYQHNPAKPYSLSSDIIIRLLVDHSGTLWTANSNGLNRFDAKTEHFTTYKLDPNRSPFYLELVEDGEHALWLGTESSGLYRFDPSTGELTNYEHGLTRSGTLSDNRVNSVYFDRSGTMWVGTQNGLNQFDKGSGTFTVYAQKDGLPGNAVGHILEDDDSNLWMGTNNGVARFNPKSRQFQSYSTPEGLPGPDLTGWSAGFKSESGEMFFGGFSGATAFHPDRIATSSFVPKIVLTDFRLSGTSVSIRSGSPLSKSITYTNSITLSHRQNIFAIEFSALSFLNAMTNRYRYKLEGLDKQWHEVGSGQRVASYTTLPRGKYVFRVQGATSRGPWSEPGVALAIEMLPPWWGTWWFTAAYSSLILLLGISAYSYRLHQISREFNLRMEERMGERTRLARELHDTLLQTILASRMVANAALDEVTDPDRMLPAMKRLSIWLEKAMEEGRSALNTLRGFSVLRNDLFDAIQRATDEYMFSSSVKIAFTVTGAVQEMHSFITEEIYRVACEAIRNACIHSGGSHVEVELRYAEDFLLRVSDNGKGIPQRVADGGKQGHFGLGGMRERAARIGADFSLRTSENCGTQIALRIPGIVAFKSAEPLPSSRFARLRSFWKRIRS